MVVTQHNHRDGVTKLIKALGQEALSDQMPNVSTQLKLKGGPQAVTRDMIVVTRIDPTDDTTKHSTTMELDIELKLWVKIKMYQRTLYGKAWA